MTSSSLSKNLCDCKSNKTYLFKSDNSPKLKGDSSLGKIGKFANAFPQDLVISAYLQLKSIRDARKHGHLCFKHEVFRCGVAPIPGIDKSTGEPYKVAIDEYLNENGEIKHSYVKMRRCASAMVCPNCGLKLRYLRGLEIKEIGEKMLNAGYTFIFLTLTARHDFNTVFRDFVDNFQASERDLKNSRTWKGFKKFNFHTIRTIEITDDNPDFKGKRSGFHYHSHTIVWLDRAPLSEDEAKELRNKLSKAWLEALNKNNLDAVDEIGLSIELPQTKNGVISDAVLLNKISNYLMKGAADEMTGDVIKSGRDGGRRISIWGLLKLACERDDPALWKRWQEYVEGIKGRSFLQFSQGLRDFCGMGKEKTDKELLESERGKPVRILENDELNAVVRQGGQGKLLRLADVEGLPGIERGIKAALAGCDILTGELLESG
ncbi:MAG: hypothetical protein LIO65_02220 [Odoribacter sp.]|nr:hypothetical protein [Odoribacter sp.]